jgi:four helix bundle protein
MRFDALEVSLELVRQLRPVIAPLRARDPALFAQIRAAASSLCLNLAEGNRRSGLDRKRVFRIAAGSADEVRAALHVSIAWGDIETQRVAIAMDLVDRVLAMLWMLTRA